MKSQLEDSQKKRFARTHKLKNVDKPTASVVQEEDLEDSSSEEPSQSEYDDKVEDISDLESQKNQN